MSCQGENFWKNPKKVGSDGPGSQNAQLMVMSCWIFDPYLSCIGGKAAGQLQVRGQIAWIILDVHPSCPFCCLIPFRCAVKFVRPDWTSGDVPTFIKLKRVVLPSEGIWTSENPPQDMTNTGHHFMAFMAFMAFFIVFGLVYNPCAAS